ncbi:hypothetical protein ABZX12_41660 [Kribbella sp. NPDC003505]|uniref:hypothetical protein n=1 Tax=Kribbella sp. NPDC003505 TaxID=3154448 RepID=UPI0033A6A171
MPEHVFVDESKTKGLLMAATLCPAKEVNGHRRTMASLLMPRERRIHFTKESPARRRKILAVIAELGLVARLYQADRNDIAARAGLSGGHGPGHRKLGGAARGRA